MADAKELDNIDEKSRLNTEGDNANIKFQPSKNGEAKIEMPDSSSTAGYQCGLTKQELMKFANDPFWVALRRVLFVLFWLLWIAMLVGAVAIIIITPKCAAPKQPEWFESAAMYELQLDQFKEAGDGSNQKADLAGVTEKLSYLDKISVSAIVLDDLFNPDNPTIMEPTRGSFDDFQALAAKKKVIVRIPMSRIDVSTEQKQTDFLKTLQFWLGKNAAGFVFDEIDQLGPQVDLSKLLVEWKRVIATFSTEEFPRVSIASAYQKRLSEADCVHLDMILNYDLTALSKGFSADQFTQSLAHTVEGRNASACRANVVLSNADIQPLIDRVTSAERDRLVIFAMLADATPFVFAGDEYSKSDKQLPAKLQRFHGKTRTPMDWKLINEFTTNPGNSFLRVFMRAAKLRKDEYAISMGNTVFKTLDNGEVVAMSRVVKGNPGFVAVTNFGLSAHTVDLSSLGAHIPETGHIDMVSSNSAKAKENVQLKQFQIDAEETIVVQFVPILG